MARKTESYMDHRVVVEPSMWGVHYPVDDATHKRLLRDCEGMAANIKRHVDDVDRVEIKCDPVHVCEFCGQVWTERGDKFNGGCCDKDMENEPKDGE